MAIIKSDIKTTDIDRGQKKLLKEVDEIGDIATSIGIHEDAEPYPSGASVQKVSFWNEFGHDLKIGGVIVGKVAARSWLRSVVDANMKKYEKLRTNLQNKILAGKITAQKALDRLGFRIENDIKNNIKKGGIKPENKPSVAARKTGFAVGRPLIDSGHFLRQIARKVEKI